MMLKLSMLLLLIAFINMALSRAISETNRSNVIIMHVNNLEWSDLGIHHNKPDNENATPNIDRLAYGGIILNHFYANGGLHSLNSGCYQRSPYGNPNLMTTYFERNGYHVNSTSIRNHKHVGELYRHIIAAVSHDNEPFFVSIDFGNLENDIKLPFIDEIVGGVVARASEVGLLDNTIIIFLSLPAVTNDTELNSSSPIESHYRRTAFIYSKMLSLPQSVSNQLFHISDILPTLVNATGLKWLTRDRIFIDGLNQWSALNTNIDVRYSIFGDNFYIKNNWKLSYGTQADTLYNNLENQELELSEGDSYDLQSYIKSITEADISPHLTHLTPEKIILMRNRAKVHCNLHDIDGLSYVINVKCSRASPCLFDLQSDPCELDDKHEPEFDVRRAQMQVTLEEYLENGLSELAMALDTDSHNILDEEQATTEEDHSVVGDPILTPSGGFGAFLTLIVTLLIFIFLLIVITCVKERCNSRRSVYVDKSKKVTFKDESDATVSNGVSTISSQVHKQQTRL